RRWMTDDLRQLSGRPSSVVRRPPSVAPPQADTSAPPPSLHPNRANCEAVERFQSERAPTRHRPQREAGFRVTQAHDQTVVTRRAVRLRLDRERSEEPATRLPERGAADSAVQVVLLGVARHAVWPEQLDRDVIIG